MEARTCRAGSLTDAAVGAAGPGRIGSAIALLLLLSSSAALAQTIHDTAAPTLDEVEPHEIPAFQPLELVLRGGGFEPGTTVYVQTGTGPQGGKRWLRVESEFVDAGELRVSLRLGFGLSLRRRAVQVRNPDGRASDPRVVSIHPSWTADASPDDPAASTTAAGDPPRIVELQPVEVDGATRFTLLIVGEGFVDGARVAMTANLNAGSFKTPSYGERMFRAEFLDSTLLELPFDRGFSDEPSRREVRVENPDGTRSEPLWLTVRPQMRRER